jgi:tripartite ATP-independent transporter DctM subunit
MEWWLVFLLLLGGLILLLSIGLPVAFSFILIDILGGYFFIGGIEGLKQLTLSIYSSLASFSLAPIPLFVLMGEIFFRSGIASRTVAVIDGLLGKVPGRLSILAVATSTLFSSLTGSTISNTALLGTTLLPQMRERGYAKSMSIGPILGSGGLAMMIPPSALAVLLASIAHISIGGILMAGLLPGLIMASLYTVYILVRCLINPSLAPDYEVTRSRFSDLVKEFFVYVCPLFSVILLVVGPIYIGMATPTEAAALGCLGAFSLAAVYKRLDWQMFRDSLSATVKISGMIFMIIAGSVGYSQIVAFSGAGAGLVEFIATLDLSKTGLVLSMLFVLLFLGCFVDQIAMMMITVPVFMPIIAGADVNPIWFCVMVLIALEVGLTSPPFGLLLFVMRGIAPKDTSMIDIYKAALPFILCNIFVIVLLLLFPGIALFLTSAVR